MLYIILVATQCFQAQPSVTILHHGCMQFGCSTGALLINLPFIYLFIFHSHFGCLEITEIKILLIPSPLLMPFNFSHLLQNHPLHGLGLGADSNLSCIEAWSSVYSTLLFSPVSRRGGRWAERTKEVAQETKPKSERVYLSTLNVGTVSLHRVKEGKSQGLLLRPEHRE